MKVLLLGIDALDRLLLEKFSRDLPNLSALQNAGTSLKVRSTFPPDSDTAWATIMTGLNPAQHGIVHFVDPLLKSYQILNVRSDNSILHGKTFWELAGRAGYKTFALFPHLCYPIWETPGVMVVRGSKDIDVQANPPDVLQDYPDPNVLLGIRGFPKRGKSGIAEHFEKLSALAVADADFALKLMRKHEWDLFFVYWSTIDAIGHFFWNSFDPDDPSFVAGNPFQNVIPDTYKIYDEIVGRFLAEVASDVTVIVMSDHGHGIRPFNLVNVNEILRQAGFLVTRDPKAHPHVGILEKAKRLGVQIVSKYGLGQLAGRAMSVLPNAMQTFTRPISIDWDRTVAYASDMSGVKAYTYGGVIINRSALGNRDYETARSEIIHLLQEACVLPDGTPLINFIARREDLYSGPFLDHYPDIVLEFKYGYGLGWAVHTPLITRAASHNLVPGSHRGETGTFIIRSSRQTQRKEIDLRDVTPTLLDLMNIPNEHPYEGTSVLT